MNNTAIVIFDMVTLASIIVTAVVFGIPALIWRGCAILRWPGIRLLRIWDAARNEEFFMSWDEVAGLLSKGKGDLECCRTKGVFFYWPDGYESVPCYYTDYPMRYWNLRNLRMDYPDIVVIVTYPF